MWLLRWVPILFLGNVFTSAMPVTKSHRLRLPFVPFPEDLKNGARSSLAIEWSIKNGSLYANENRVYPPSATMQLRVPLLEGTGQTHLSGKTVDISYILDNRPLSTHKVGFTVRARLQFFDLNGNLVSPNAAVIDLRTYPNGHYHITRIRMGPAWGSDKDGGFTQNSPPWVVKYWRTQYGFIFEPKPTSPIHNLIPAMDPSSNENTGKVTSNETAVKDKSGLSISPFQAASSPASSNHHSGHSHPHHENCLKNSFMRIINHTILPAVIGAVVGVVACLVGFFLGHILMSLAIRFGWHKTQAQRLPTILDEKVTTPEKSPMVPQISIAPVSTSLV
ncbi:hypothetical protein N7457_007578 [Penicillium paradoxum]|uniref:uncharacterized protein n=1 Tax=Penicillium paradoxum TaxID=176176 RepID=UPI0025467C76|nr:uncharacterized protein N7457_007578 [Penicillium paradoxum]KAJ5779858.1 hypothetical protein N7457_007578 [Penicillium paradoxum]